jgi:DNA-directed RNA polymerase subunit omega
MLYPSIDKLVEKVDSKYALVVAASQRARQLTEGEDRRRIAKPVSHKNVGIALEEIYKDRVVVEKEYNEDEDDIDDL